MNVVPSKSRFQVGETVVVVSPRTPSMYGTKYIVKAVRESPFGGHIVSSTKDGMTGWHEDSLMSEEIYNSKLNLAMKEVV